MEELQQLFNDGQFDKLIAQTAGNAEFDVLCLRARAYIALEQFDPALDSFASAVSSNGVWKECVGAFGTLLDDIGAKLVTLQTELLSEYTCDLNAYETLQAALNTTGRYISYLDQLRDIIRPTCPMPGMVDALGTPQLNRAADAFANGRVDCGEAMIRQALKKYTQYSTIPLNVRKPIEEYTKDCFRQAGMGRMILQKTIPLIELDNEENAQSRARQCERVIQILVTLLNTNGSYEEYHGPLYLYGSEIRQETINELKAAITMMYTIDTTYAAPAIPPLMDPTPQASEPAPAQQGGGCYVATCVYGSYDCPQVWTLRRYRDITLASTWYGRAFVRVYYAVSPTLVRWFGGYNWFKKFWKGRLDAMVHRLQKDGVDSTPYQDRSW